MNERKAQGGRFLARFIHGIGAESVVHHDREWKGVTMKAVKLQDTKVPTAAPLVDFEAKEGEGKSTTVLQQQEAVPSLSDSFTYISTLMIPESSTFLNLLTFSSYVLLHEFDDQLSQDYVEVGVLQAYTTNVRDAGFNFHMVKLTPMKANEIWTFWMVPPIGNGTPTPPEQSTVNGRSRTHLPRCVGTQTLSPLGGWQR